jgi:DNA-binding response OmpR family regulator
MAPFHVLIVEDEWLIAKDYVSILRAAGHVAVAGSALALLDTEQVDVAVLDFHLGDKTSTSVVRRLNQSGIPLIVVTGHSTDDLPPEFGPVAVVAKPANPEQLVALIERLAV